MKLLFVRHGDPDYEHDSLTEKGFREAALLSERLGGLDARAWYVSPLGRAKDTAAPTLARAGAEAVEKDWLREFHAPIRRPDAGGRETVTWDWLPQDWTAEERFYDCTRWHEPAVMAGVKAEYDRVTSGLDEVLAEHGYVREGRLYRAAAANNGALVFFCHFGVECVMVSHLLNVSPMVLWHGACALPTSVTTLVTEERREGIALFRMTGFGDLSHLYAGGEPPAFAARFRECYGNRWERRD